MKAPVEKKVQLACAVLTALLLWIPAQKWGLFPLAWIGLAPIFLVASEMDAKARLRYGWRAGFLFYVLTSWWILPTIIYGSPMIGVGPAIGALLGVLAVAFIAFVHGWQFAIALWLWDVKKWHRYLWALPIVIAAWWGFFDWLRCLGPLAHIWGALAFTQWRDVQILQIAPLVGQHGITTLVVWFGVCMALCASTRRAAVAAIPVFVALTIHLWGASQLNNRPSHKFSALLVSTNVPSLRKSNAAVGESPAQAAWHLTNGGMLETEWYLGDHAIIVWPETTLEAWQVDNRIKPVTQQIKVWNHLQELLKRKVVTNTGTHQPQLLTGVGLHRLEGLKEDMQNTAMLLKYGQQPQSSPKIRTVPMGERAPFGDYIPFLKRLAPTPEVTPGTAPKTLNLNGIPIGTVICFESCFPEPARSLKRQGAKALFIITNDEYFKGTNAPWEHAAMAVMRAAENQIPVAQVANGGYTLWIDSHGRIMHQSFGAGATLISLPSD
jgi:apolipoprotein N-acyltransferase